MNPLRRWFLGSGRFPEPVRGTLSAEGMRFLEEGLPGSITYRHYRAPGRRTNWSRELFTGAIAITGRRVVVYAGRRKHVDVPHDHPLRAALIIGTEHPDEISFSIAAEDFHRDRSGQIQIRLRTTNAEQIIALLT